MLNLPSNLNQKYFTDQAITRLKDEYFFIVRKEYKNWDGVIDILTIYGEYRTLLRYLFQFLY